MPDFTDVVVLMMVVMNPAGGGISINQEFYSKEACENAAIQMVAKVPRSEHVLKVDKDMARHVCVPKYMDSKVGRR